VFWYWAENAGGLAFEASFATLGSITVENWYGL
jgi:hypothetical protein